MLNETFIKKTLDKHLKPPKLYHHICRGGSSRTVLDVWSTLQKYSCPLHRDGIKKVVTPQCEGCDGYSREYQLSNTDQEERYNRAISDFALKLIAELPRGPCNYNPLNIEASEKRVGLWDETPIN